jgi:hypothetical protein
VTKKQKKNGKNLDNKEGESIGKEIKWAKKTKK